MSADKDFDPEWIALLDSLKAVIGKRPNLDAILFLIGVQELGKGKRNYSKEEKQDLMHIGICKLLSLSGYYELEGQDQDGWPHWKLIKPLPQFDLREQEKLLKMHIKEYFKTL
ncbi:MAG: hypothetical protein NVV82_24025 [Sporocytophaga sp.]|jgi:hypothetical protein|nr:hypothetical protein [Sporocytophaga sp.]